MSNLEKALIAAAQAIAAAALADPDARPWTEEELQKAKPVPRVKIMTDEEVLAAALSDPDAQPLTPEDLARMKRTPREEIMKRGPNS